MNESMKLMYALGNVQGAYIDRALEEALSPVRRPRAVGTRRSFRTLLAAAVIAALLIALGAAAYAATWFGIKDALLHRSDDTLYVSAQGLESTAEFKAYQEFLDFYNDYVSNDYCGDAVPQEQDEWMRAHERVYFCYTKRLKDKIMELCDKYSLSPRDGAFEYDGDIDRLYAVCGVDGFLCDEGFDSDNVGFICYGDGSFTLQGLWSTADSGHAVDFTVTRSMKGYFGQGYIPVETDTLQEWNYVTALGAPVTVVMGEYSSAVLYDGADAFVTAELVRFDKETSYDGTAPVDALLGAAFARERLERFADGIDFASLGTASRVDLNAAVTDAAYTDRQTELQIEYEQDIARGLASVGDTVMIMNGLECTVNSIELSDNIYSAGWMLDEFHESFACVGGAAYIFPDYVDSVTGALIDGLKLVTVDVSVHNANADDVSGNGGLAGSGENNFGNCVFYLQSGSVRRFDGGYDYPCVSCVAYTGENPIPGQYAYVHINPGDTVRYRLGYILDDTIGAPDNAYLYCIRDINGELRDCYIPIDR